MLNKIISFFTKSKPNPAKIFANYDWDDNIIFMPTHIIFFAKDASNPIQELAVSTEGFAHTRSTVGVTSHVLNFVKKDEIYVLCEAATPNSIMVDIVNYQINYQDDASFREFRDHDTIDYFLNDLKIALKENKFGPSFQDFVEHCAHPESAKNVKIITARGQSPKTLHRGMKYLQENGYIKYVPDLANVFPVSYKGPELSDEFKASASSPQEAKMKVLASVLDMINTHHIGATFGFSDDDKKTYDFTENFIRTEIEKNRWTNIEINLYFTGNKIKQRAKLLTLTSSDVA